MGHRIIRQPDGLYAVFSSVVDNFVLVNATPKDIVRYWTRKDRRDNIRRVGQAIKQIDAGTVQYLGPSTFDDALKLIRDIHGKAAVDEALAFIADDAT